MPITIHPFDTQFTTEIVNLHHACVHAIDPTIYSLEQQEAWAHTPPNYPYWEKRLALKKPFVAMVEATIVGFIELEANGHIDCAYTHPAYQKCGVMSELYTYAQNVAQQKSIKRLFLEASIVAKPFFEKRGFVTLSRNEIKRNGQMIVNFSMEKMLS